MTGWDGKRRMKGTKVQALATKLRSCGQFEAERSKRQT